MIQIRDNESSKNVYRSPAEPVCTSLLLAFGSVGLIQTQRYSQFKGSSFSLRVKVYLKTAVVALQITFFFIFYDVLEECLPLYFCQNSLINFIKIQIRSLKYKQMVNFPLLGCFSILGIFYAKSLAKRQATCKAVCMQQIITMPCGTNLSPSKSTGVCLLTSESFSDSPQRPFSKSKESLGLAKLPLLPAL